VRAVVIALGKVGLPLAVKIALAGHEVVGCDTDPRVTRLVGAGCEPFPGEDGLGEALRALVDAGRLRVTTDTRAAVSAGPELIALVPPVLIDERHAPDFQIIDAVIGEVGAALRRGTLVSVETTVPVGSTRGRFAPALERASGLRAERDFYVVHSPERVYSGRVLRDLDAYPKLVGGLSAAGEQRAVELYGSFLSAEVRPLGSAEAAELTKLAETTYRDVNIALANELALHADRLGLDIRAVIDAANSQPFSHIHRPGIAVGGHCIPVYPRFLQAGAPEARLPPLAREINEAMPAYALARLEAALQSRGWEARGLEKARVLILGVSYRGGVKESAFSGALALRELLAERGATALATDPLYTDDELRALGFCPWRGEEIDAAILQAEHDEFRRLAPADLPGLRVLLDGRDAVDPEPWRAAGVRVLRLGRPDVAPADA
jgi:UDP-N-acetyl-D-glucosamine dehydrogenase